MKSIHHVNPAFAENQPIAKNPPFFRWWITIGYYGLCIPHKPVLNTDGSCKLQSSKLQKVTRPPFTYSLFRKEAVFPCYRIIYWFTVHLPRRDMGDNIIVGNFVFRQRFLGRIYKSKHETP